MTRTRSAPRLAARIDRLSGGTWLVLILGGVSLLMVTAAALAPVLAPPGSTVAGPGAAPVWLIAALLASALAALVVPAAFDAAAVAHRRRLPRPAARVAGGDARVLAGGATVLAAGVAGVVAGVEHRAIADLLRAFVALCAWTSAVALVAVAWIGAARPVGLAAAAAAALAGVAFTLSPLGPSERQAGPAGWALGIGAVVGAAAAMAWIARAWRRLADDDGQAPETPPAGPVATPSPRDRLRAWWVARVAQGPQSRFFDPTMAVPMAVVLGQMANPTLTQLNTGREGLWASWGGDVTAAWPLRILVLAALAVLSLRGADLHWRWLLAPTTPLRRHLARRLFFGTWRFLALTIGGVGLAVTVGWLLLDSGGAALRDAGVATLAAGLVRHAVPFVVDLALAVAVAVWLRALSPRPGVVLGVLLAVALVIGIALVWTTGRPPFDAPVLWPRDAVHLAGTAVLAALVAAAARWQWSRVGWLAQHAQARGRVAWARGPDD